ncbi:uncharacterized protein EAF01_006246 [Botrytis porri]|uniref:uncharacterized protein n=1 Tax=Botrytis porri TaxID=87229 RepID=UPI0018FFE4E9|nr:uncharacterized protein EAF01_006246 [Botrytis porri]KAF7903197.1 hypothetical protein EAF01_006246 [Botrytis porri]
MNIWKCGEMKISNRIIHPKHTLPALLSTVGHLFLDRSQDGGRLFVRTGRSVYGMQIISGVGGI